MRDDGADVEGIRALVRDGIRPPLTPALLARLRYHRLAPLAYEAHSTPELRDAATEAAAHDLAATGALRQAVGILEYAGLEFLLYKGIALGTQLYGRSDLRPREDIDILLDGWDCVERAERSFVDAGWSSLPRLEGRHAVHAAAMQRAGRPSVDLHARVSQRHRVAGALPYAHLYAGRVMIDVPGVGPLPTLAPRDALLAGALHYSAHHGAQVAPLIWVEDLARLCERLSDRDWELVLERAAEHELVTALAHALGEVRWWTAGAQPPAWVHEALADVRDASVVYVDRPTPPALFLDDLLVLDHVGGLELLRELVFPGKAFLAQRAGVSRPRPYAILWADRLLRAGRS